MQISRRELLRIGSSVVVCSAAIPLTSITRALAKHSKPASRKKTEVHFTGKHAYAAILDKAVDEKWSMLPMGDLIGQIATYLLGTPYVNYTLDHSADHEYCIVNLQELDCVTFVESTLALARAIKLGDNDDESLAKQVELIRYRNGECNGFCSRLHYLSDWFYDNEKKHLLHDYTKELKGAEKTDKQLSLMSSRSNQYKQLKAHPELVPAIRHCELAINKRPHYYLPKADVQAAEEFMQTGDIIAITTSAKILDCAHTGFCYRDDKGLLRFLHASLTHKKVWLDQELAAYLNGIHAFTGIMVARPAEPV
ncbi:MAG TPA: N-acetylmuramoyl-L-alanine amidase-like domain-containing protein [Fimbriimonadaceae bacterium]|jgi:hypothetical protein